MAISVKIYNPAGVETDVTAWVLGDSIGGLNLRLEDDTCAIVADDLTIDFKNEDGKFVGGSGLWTLPLDPTLRTSESTGNGQWRVTVAKNAATRFIGDLDVSSVVVDYKNKAVSTTWLGKVKRAEKDATSIKRVTTDPLSFTCVRNNRKLTFSDTIANLGLQVGDRIKTSQLTLNGNVIDQELEIKEVGVTASLTASQARVRQSCKRAYTAGSVVNPFYKTVAGNDLTVAECVTYCFNALGVAAGNQVISGTGTTLVVDEFDTEDKTISECLTELAQYAGCIWFCDSTKWYFIDRNSAKSVAAAKDISSLLMEESKQAANEDYYDCVKVTGRAPRLAPNSEPRYYLYGSGRSSVYEIETDFTSDMDTLQSIAEQVYASVCIIRKKAEIKVKDDGTAYQIWDKVTFDSEDWYVVEVSEPMRSVETGYLDSIDLVCISVTGTTPAASALDRDHNLDDDPPYPPDEIALSSGKLSKRQTWWSEFRAAVPKDVAPLIIEDKVTRETTSGDETVYTQQYMLWAVRFKWPYGGGVDYLDTPDGFELSVYKDNETPDNVSNDGRFVRRHKGLKQPLADANGYYYMWFYKPMVTDAPDFNVVVRTWIAGKELSAYSDSVSTADYGGPDDGGGTMLAPMIQSVTRVYSSTLSQYVLRIVFTYAEDLSADTPLHVWVDTSPDINGDPETGSGWTATAENIVEATATGSNWYVDCPHYDGSTGVTTSMPIACKLALAVYDTTSPTPVRQSEFAYYDFSDYSASIPQAYPSSFTFDDPGNKIDATWAWLSTFLKSGTVTTSIASPCVVAWTAHGLTVGTPVVFSTTGALPTGITAGTTYYVISAGFTADQFQISTSIGGSAVNTSGTQSGTHTCKSQCYAYALTYHGTDLADACNPPYVPTSGAVTPTNWEAATAYQASRTDNTRIFTIVDSGESGHKYFTLSGVATLDVDHAVGTETSSTLYASCALILFRLDASGNMNCGQWGARFYYATTPEWPDLELTWTYSPPTINQIKCQWVNDGNTYYVPIVRKDGAGNCYNVQIQSSFSSTAGYKWFVLLAPSVTQTYYFRLATENTYGNLPGSPIETDSKHGPWYPITTGGTD